MVSLDGIERPSLASFKMASKNAMNSAKLMVGLTNENDIETQSQQDQQSQDSERTFLDEATDLICPDLTFQQRLIGFATCFTIAYLITFMSFKFFIDLIEGYPVPFALNYSFGNILALGSSWFLCGPKRQFRNMMDDKRRITSMTYLGCLGLTLIIVFIPLPWGLKLFILICLIVTQCCSSFWYSLSYVPYGRRAVLNFIKRTLGLNEGPIPISMTEG